MCVCVGGGGLRGGEETDFKKDRLADRQADRQANMQTDRQTDRRCNSFFPHTHTFPVSCSVIYGRDKVMMVVIERFVTISGDLFL